MYNESVPVSAGADLDTDQQYHAIAIGGTIAATAGATLGILQNKPKNGEDASLVYSGRSKYRAGGAVTAGNRVTVTTSGWFVAVSSNQFGCGTALETVASGGIAEGIFNFAGARSTVSSANFT